MCQGRVYCGLVRELYTFRERKIVTLASLYIYGTCVKQILVKFYLGEPRHNWNTKNKCKRIEFLVEEELCRIKWFYKVLSIEGGNGIRGTILKTTSVDHWLAMWMLDKVSGSFLDRTYLEN